MLLKSLRMKRFEHDIILLNFYNYILICTKLEMHKFRGLLLYSFKLKYSLHSFIYLF